MVVLDASVWVSNLLPDEPRHSESRQWLRGWMSTPNPVVVPRLFVAEVGAAIARRRRSPADGATVVSDIRSEPLVDIRDVSRERWDRVADLAVQRQLRAADAVYLALAEELGLPLVTWDQELLARSGGIDVRTPDQVPV